MNVLPLPSSTLPLPPHSALFLRPARSPRPSLSTHLPPSRRSARFARLPTAARRNSTRRCDRVTGSVLRPRPSRVSPSRDRLGRPGHSWSRARGRSRSLLAEAERGRAERRRVRCACVEGRSRRQARPPEPPAFGDGRRQRRPSATTLSFGQDGRTSPGSSLVSTYKTTHTLNVSYSNN